MVRRLLTIASLGLAATTGVTQGEMVCGQRPQTPETVLATDGQSHCLIVYPRAAPAYQLLAERLATGIEATTGARPDAVSDDQVMDANDWRVQPRYRDRTLILIGNINNNRAMLPLYADSLLGADGYYPGGDGYTLRSVCNPYGNGVNNIALGASSQPGTEAAVDAFVAQLPEWWDGHRLVIPRLLEVHPGGRFAKVMEKAVTDASSRGPTAGTWGPAYGLGWNGMEYNWTGAEIFLKNARLSFEELLTGEIIGAGDYQLEAMVRGLNCLNGTGLLSDKELAEFNDKLLLGVRAMEDSYWLVLGPGMARVPPGHEHYLDLGIGQQGGPLGNRHQTFGTSAVHFTARYLLRTGMPNGAGRQYLNRLNDLTGQYLDCAFSAWKDDEDSRASFQSQEPIIRAAFSAEKPTFFAKGNSYMAALRAFVNLDNLGHYAGTGTYEGARPGGVQSDHSTGFALSAAAYYYRDPHLKMLVSQLPGMSIGSWGGLIRLGVGGYRVGDSLEANPWDPDALEQVVKLPVDPYHYNLYCPDLPWEQCFDSICFRENLERTGQYMLLQGVQRIQDDARDGNSIIRYTDQGHVWLFANTDLLTHYDRNAVFVSNGYNADSPGRVVRVDFVEDTPDASACGTTLRDHGASDWQRNVFWRKGRYFAVLDRIRAKDSGPYTATCSWRTPGFARLQEGGWAAYQGDATMVLKCASEVDATADHASGLEGAARPYRLRQRQMGELQAGEDLTFLNVLCVSSPQQRRRADVRPVSRWALILRGVFEENGREVREQVVIGIRPPSGVTRIAELETDAALFYLSRNRVFCAEASFCRWRGQPLVFSDDTGWADLPSELNLNASWGAADSRATAADEPAPGAAAEWQPAWTCGELDKQGSEVDIVSLIASREPDEGRVEELVDGGVPLWNSIVWKEQGGETVQITFELPEVTPLAQLEILGGNAGWCTVPEPFSQPGKPMTIKLSNDAFQSDVREVDLPRTHTYWLGDIYKGQLVTVPKTVLDASGHSAKYIRFSQPTFSAREIVIRANDAQGTRIERIMAADLDGDGASEVIVATNDGQLAAISAHGKMLWREQFRGRITFLTTGDLEGDGLPEVLVTTLERTLYAFRGAGQLLWKAVSPTLDRKRDELGNPHSIGLFPPDEAGRRRIIVGCYHYFEVYDSHGNLVHAARDGGSWLDQALPEAVDFTGDGVPDTVLRCMHWSGLALLNGADWSLSYIPSFTGAGLGMLNWDLPQRRPGALVVAEVGVALYDLVNRKTVWARDDGPITAFDVADADGDGRDDILIGKEDGYVLVLDTITGQPKTRLLIGQPITGLRVLPKGDAAQLVVGTNRGVEIRDMSGSPLASYPVACNHLELAGAPAAPLIVALTPSSRAVALPITD